MTTFLRRAAVFLCCLFGLQSTLQAQNAITIDIDRNVTQDSLYVTVLYNNAGAAINFGNASIVFSLPEAATALVTTPTSMNAQVSLEGVCGATIAGQANAPTTVNYLPVGTRVVITLADNATGGFAATANSLAPGINTMVRIAFPFLNNAAGVLNDAACGLAFNGTLTGYAVGANRLRQITAFPSTTALVTPVTATGADAFTNLVPVAPLTTAGVPLTPLCTAADVAFGPSSNVTIAQFPAGVTTLSYNWFDDAALATPATELTVATVTTPAVGTDGVYNFSGPATSFANPVDSTIFSMFIASRINSPTSGGYVCNGTAGTEVNWVVSQNIRTEIVYVTPAPAAYFLAGVAAEPDTLCSGTGQTYDYTSVGGNNIPGAATIAPLIFQWGGSLGNVSTTAAITGTGIPNGTFNVTLSTGYIATCLSPTITDTTLFGIEIPAAVAGPFTIAPAGPYCTGDQITLSYTGAVAPTTDILFDYVLGSPTPQIDGTEGDGTFLFTLDSTGVTIAIDVQAVNEGPAAGGAVCRAPVQTDAYPAITIGTPLTFTALTMVLEGAADAGAGGTPMTPTAYTGILTTLFQPTTGTAATTDPLQTVLPSFFPDPASSTNIMASGSVPANALDVVRLELRDNANALLDFTYGYVLETGAVVDFYDGTGSPNFCATGAANHKVVGWHRNHLPLMKSPVDFTTSPTVAFDAAGGLDPADGGLTVLVAGSGETMPAGNITDLTGDMFAVNAADFFLAYINFVVPGAVTAANYGQNDDVNLDGNLNAADYNTVLANNNQLLFSTVGNVITNP